MRLRFRHLLAAGSVAAILAAPTAIADPGTTCTDVSGSDTQCSSPGNVQINDSPPFEDPAMQGVYPGPYPVPWFEGGR